MDKINQTKNSFFSKTFWITLLVKQNKWHRYGVLIHTLKVTLGAIKNKDYKFIAAGLFHDLGKPGVAFQKPEDIINNEYSFIDHEERSYQIVKNWFFLSDWTKNVIRYHYIIRDIRKCTKKGNLERLTRLQKTWDTFDDDFIKDLEQFLIYDDYGKE